MISIKKVSQLPITGILGTCAQQSKKVACVTSYAHGAVISEQRQMQGHLIGGESPDGQISVVQLPSPIELKMMGIDKFFAEKRGSELVACAATKKLLAEEHLRRELQSLGTPINSIVREHWRTKPSTLRPICPLTKEEL